MPMDHINESILNSRELALDLKYRGKDSSKVEIEAALRAMNEHLFRTESRGISNQTFPTMLRAKEAFIDLPPATQSVEQLHRLPLMQSRIERALIQGNIDSFRWIGASGLALFGLQLSEVDILNPQNLNPDNAFVPVLAIEA